MSLDETHLIGRYSVTGRFIIPLPKSLPDSFKNAEFPAGDIVLALYPETTCFYRATVVAPPSKVGLALGGSWLKKYSVHLTFNYTRNLEPAWIRLHFAL
jgi:hypothetical protein